MLTLCVQDSRGASTCCALHLLKACFAELIAALLVVEYVVVWLIWFHRHPPKWLRERLHAAKLLLTTPVICVMACCWV